MNKPQEQFERTKRWFKLFEEITNGKSHDRVSDHYEDVVYSFFQNCWHLKDWIINSGSLDKNLVEEFFHGNVDLKLCQALAIGSKHLTINSPHVDKGVKVARRAFSLSLGGGTPQIKVVYWIESDDKQPQDAFVIASNCLVQCEIFLRQNGLLPQT